MLHRSHLCLLDKLILCSLNFGVRFLTRFKFEFLEYLLSKYLIVATHFLCLDLKNIRRMQTLKAWLLPSLGILTLQLRLKHFLLVFKKISLGYEFVKLLFRLWIWTPSTFVSLFLANHIHTYLNLPSNTNYEKNDH